MAANPIHLPLQLQQEAEQWAANQGIPLEQFILWAVAEKVTALKSQFADPAFPEIAYRQGASGQPSPVVRGTGIRVQAIVIATHQWGLSIEQLAEEYGLSAAQIQEALAFYNAHQPEIDSAISSEGKIAVDH